MGLSKYFGSYYRIRSLVGYPVKVVDGKVVRVAPPSPSEVRKAFKKARARAS